MILLCLLPEFRHFLKLPYIFPGIYKIWTSVGISSTLTLIITSASSHVSMGQRRENQEIHHKIPPQGIKMTICGAKSVSPPNENWKHVTKSSTKLATAYMNKQFAVIPTDTSLKKKQA